MALIVCVIVQINAYHQTLPFGGYSYVDDSSGHFINVKFGRSIPSVFNRPLYQSDHFRSSFELPVRPNPNAIPNEKKLFVPVFKQVARPESDGQYEEYLKFMKEEAEQNAKSTGKNSNSQSYVSVQLGDKGYNYQY